MFGLALGLSGCVLDPACPEGQKTGADGTCVEDTGSTDSPADTDTDTDADTDADGDSDTDTDTDTQVEDADGDTYSPSEGDCDDTNAAINPGAPEVCNGRDDDCDTLIDTDAVDATTWYTDADADTYGATGTGVLACDQPFGSVEGEGDCDDGDAAVNPAATEVCNGVDDDCDLRVDTDAVDAGRWLTDGDGDGYGTTPPTFSCEQPPGAVELGGDCDDADANVYPDAAELCNGVDDDCDGDVDVGAWGESTFYEDTDGDGFGTSASVDACEVPPGYAAESGDCDDTDDSYYPGAAEDCADGVDRNCDGQVGEGDADADGEPACTDCDDTDAAAFPGNVEVCDGVDNDCDGGADVDAVDASTYYADADGDFYGANVGPVVACEAPVGFTLVTGDCDDADAATYPGASEACDRVDNDCDAVVDEDGNDACYDTGLAIVWVAGDASVDGDGAFAGGRLGLDYTVAADLPALTSLCEVMGEWADSGVPLDTACVDCDWAFNLVATGTTASGERCDAVGGGTSPWDGLTAGFGFAETYELPTGYGYTTVDTVVFYNDGGTWLPLSYNVAGVGYNTGDRYAMTFRARYDELVYYYP